MQVLSFPGRRSASMTALAVVLFLVTLGAPPALAAAGDLDPGFDGDGKVTTPFPIGSFANDLAIQSDGRIVAVGAAAGDTGTGEFAIARYDTDGGLDATFGVGGMVTTPIAGGGGDEARSVAIQPNGKIVVAGTDSYARFAVVRYRSGGTLDASFGGDGIVRTDLSPSGDIGYDVAIQADGRIVVVGRSGDADARSAVLRYRSDGRLDRSFGERGTVLSRRWGVARAVALQPDGRIVVTGYDTYGLVVARFLTDGTPDDTFGGDGFARRVVSEIFPLSVALQPSGRIVVGGDYDIFARGLARFTARGRLDDTFGGDGVVQTQVGSGEQAVAGLAIQPNGRIVAAGYYGPHEGGTTEVFHIAVTRHLRNGKLDDSWSGNGKVVTSFAGGAYARGVALQPDGKVVVAGGAGDPQAFALVRYLV
ncbi:MAG TPA: delta-60 repeat domain-containing protein [Actinomycetota bacterium]|nr:delta-60 repeat domain-containing protein [Actinomycetota bacterium]